MVRRAKLGVLGTCVLVQKLTGAAWRVGVASIAGVGVVRTVRWIEAVCVGYTTVAAAFVATSSVHSPSRVMTS